MIPPFYHDGTQGMFRTKATLVLCPSHLAKQWETEVGKHTNPALKVRWPVRPPESVACLTGISPRRA
jgi:hypothetical protein